MTRREDQTSGPFTNFGRFLRFGVLGAVGFGINIAVTGTYSFSGE